MRRNRGILIIVLCIVLIVFLVGVLFNNTNRGISVGNFSFINIGNTKLTEEDKYNASLENVKTIKLETTVDDIIIEEGNEKDIQIIEKSNYKLDENEKLKISNNDDTLEIVRNDKKIIASKININRRLEIYLPKDYNGTLLLDNNVGDIKINCDLKLDKLSISQDVGDLKLSSNIECTNFNSKNNVGDTKIENLVCEEYSIKTSTGDIDINGIAGFGKIDGKIGNVDCTLNKISGDISITATTGDVDILVSGSESFILDSKSNVGDIETNINLDNCKTSQKSLSGSYGKDATYNMIVETNVGDIKIDTK
ncbi:MAG: DUF4097 family beta strand repeat-containing protein [Peptostreptococcaceae bacterium]